MSRRILTGITLLLLIAVITSMTAVAADSTAPRATGAQLLTDAKLETARLDISFNEKIEINGGGVSVKDSKGNVFSADSWDAKISSDGMRAIFNASAFSPRLDLYANRTYTVTVDKDSFMDKSQNATEKDFVFNISITYTTGNAPSSTAASSAAPSQAAGSSSSNIIVVIPNSSVPASSSSAAAAGANTQAPPNPNTGRGDSPIGFLVMTAAAVGVWAITRRKKVK